MRLGHFDLNLFIALDALLETCSITRASERLHIGASATSSALGRLRDHFGDELLVPVGRRMDPTPLALTLKGPVRDIILRSKGTLATKAGFDPTIERRHFSINASDYVSTVLLAPFTRLLADEAPGITIDILGLTSNVSQRLDQGEIDFIFLPRRNANPDHPLAHIFSDDYLCMIWCNSRYAKAGALSLEDYLSGEHVAARFGELRTGSYEDWAISNANLTRNVSVTASNFNALPFLVLGTNRIATVHRRLAETYAPMLPITTFPTPFPIPELQIIMQWNIHKEQDLSHKWLRERIQLFAASV